MIGWLIGKNKKDSKKEKRPTNFPIVVQLGVLALIAYIILNDGALKNQFTRLPDRVSQQFNKGVEVAERLQGKSPSSASNILRDVSISILNEGQEVPVHCGDVATILLRGSSIIPNSKEKIPFYDGITTETSIQIIVGQNKRTSPLLQAAIQELKLGEVAQVIMPPYHTLKDPLAPKIFPKSTILYELYIQSIASKIPQPSGDLHVQTYTRKDAPKDLNPRISCGDNVSITYTLFNHAGKKIFEQTEPKVFVIGADQTPSILTYALLKHRYSQDITAIIPPNMEKSGNNNMLPLNNDHINLLEISISRK